MQMPVHEIRRGLRPYAEDHGAGGITDGDGDREIVALLSACLAYGRVDLFGRALDGVLAAMGPSPAAFIRDFDPDRDGHVFATFIYRFNRPRDLVAFCSADGPVDSAAIRDALGRALPPYMVPAAIHGWTSLPLTANGKTDRKALEALAAGLDGAEAKREEPGTDAERRLAAAWAEVLALPREQIGRRDNFFDLGGTSLSVVKLAVALGRAVPFKDLAARPVLTDQAALIDKNRIVTGGSA